MKHTIVLEFADKETVDFINLICKRKGITLEGYIVDNLEWDDKPACFDPEVSRITHKVCEECDYFDRCPDVKKKKIKR